MATDATTVVPIPALDKDGSQAVLKLSTNKNFNGSLYSTASVEFHKGDFVTCEIFGDFRKVVQVRPTTRATQRAIDAQHSAVFTPAFVEVLKEEAIAFYANKSLIAR